MEIVNLVDRNHTAASQDVLTMLKREIARIESGEIDMSKYNRHAVLLYAEMDGGEIRSLSWAKAGGGADMAVHICNRASLSFAAMLIG